MSKEWLKNDILQLRAPELTDLDFLFHIENDTRLWSVSACKIPYSHYQLHKYITESSNDIYIDRQLRLMITDADNELSGAIDLIDFSPASHRAEIGIVISEEKRGKGYATAALELVIQYAKEILNLHQLYAYVFTDNEAACRLFQKTGFKASSELKDWEYRNGKYKNVYLFQLIIQQ